MRSDFSLKIQADLIVPFLSNKVCIFHFLYFVSCFFYPRCLQIRFVHVVPFLGYVFIFVSIFSSLPDRLEDSVGGSRPVSQGFHGALLCFMMLTVMHVLNSARNGMS